MSRSLITLIKSSHSAPSSFVAACSLTNGTVYLSGEIVNASGDGKKTITSCHGYLKDHLGIKYILNVEIESSVHRPILP